MPYESYELSITMSVGVSCFVKQCVETGAELIGNADRALYQAKARKLEEELEELRGAAKPAKAEPGA